MNQIFFQPWKATKKIHPTALDLSLYLPKVALAAPLAPLKKGWEYAVPDSVWADSMLGNDLAGDCAEACALHTIMGNSAANKAPQVFTQQDAFDLYAAVTGYDPSQTQPDDSNPTDNGTAYSDLFTYWQNTGIKGDKILGVASVNFNVRSMLNAAIYFFGSVLVGCSVTQSMMDDFNAGNSWDTFSGAVLGRHAVPMFGYGSKGNMILTWARRQPAGLNFVSMIDEAYVVITQAWVNAQNRAPSGIDLAALTADLAAMKQR